MTATVCDDVRERRFLGRDTPADAAHAATCDACGADAAALARVGAAFSAHPVETPSPALAARVLTAARPLLAAKRRHAARHALAAAVAAALLPLPIILLVDIWALGTMYAWLTRLLPPALSLYLVVNYAAVLALLGALTYGAIPLLAERQARGLVRLPMSLGEAPHG
jgi:hypothetical protein